MRIPTLLSLALVLFFAPSTRAEEAPLAHARHLGPCAQEVQLVSIQRLAGATHAFALTLEVAMPEPMWKLTVDSVAQPDETGRMLVRLSGTRPAGSLPQVITMTRVEVPVGTLSVGDYLVDILVRTPPNPHRRMGALALRATR